MDVDRISDEELSLWLAFDSLKGTGFGPKRVIQLCDRFRGVKAAWEASKQDLMVIAEMHSQAAETLVQKRSTISPGALLEAIRKTGSSCLCYGDPLYPLRLRQIHDPPLILYVQGELLPTDFDHVVAVVGTRRPTAYGQKAAKDFARDLASSKVLVLSGLAIGIDSLAHWGAIDGNGRTIAVVATGPDLVYPSSNKRLYTEILNGHGAIVSEYPPGTTAEKWRFPARNRIISGLSDAILVVEAGESSGSLITAQLGFEQNRDVFAVPGRVDSPMSIGTNSLICKNMAHLARNYQDILDELEWATSSSRSSPTIVELFGREKEIFELLSNEPVHFDVLCEKSGMAAGEMSATLTMLELAGLVTRQQGDWYSRQSDSVSYTQAAIPNAH